MSFSLVMFDVTVQSDNVMLQFPPYEYGTNDVHLLRRKQGTMYSACNSNIPGQGSTQYRWPPFCKKWVQKPYVHFLLIG